MSGPLKYLNVAEKNNAAKHIASYLSNGTSRRREGLSKFNKIYEFESEVLGHRCTMVMTSVSGHLLEIDFNSGYGNWQSCDPSALFDAPIVKQCSEKYQNIEETLRREIRDCRGLIIWTDCDREGENIGFEIIRVCTAVKNNIKIYRAKFSEITAVSVRRALQNLEQPNKNTSDAVDVRQELDLRIGAAFTRFQTMNAQQNLDYQHLVSYGSCQFPTLGFVVERYKIVEAFVAQKFWEIKVTHTLNNLSVDFAWERGRQFGEELNEESAAVYRVCNENQQAGVIEVTTVPVSKLRPLPLTTVEFEKLASSKLNIKAKEAMDFAEKLYTQGFISYPRTETNKYPENMNLRKIVNMFTNHSKVGSFARRILNRGGPNPRQGDKSDQAHPPIHPVRYLTKLHGNEKRLYELIVRSFLACCSEDAEGLETLVTVEVANEKFVASGHKVTAQNYLHVYPYEQWLTKEIHIYKQGQKFDPTSIDLVVGSTSPPDLLTESDLIDLMEQHAIGTDATHVSHIETIKDRKYVTLTNDNRFIPGPLGLGLVEGYEAMGLSVTKPQHRAELEADLQAIAEGRKQPQEVKAEQIAKHREFYRTLSVQAHILYAAISQRFSQATVSKLETAPSASGSSSNTAQIDDEFDTDSSDNNCYCGETCRRNTVRKEGPNKGRVFFGCDNYDSHGGGCNYFQWADNDSDSEANCSREETADAAFVLGLSGPSHSREPICNCGDKCDENTVYKLGPNQGRSFYGCPNYGSGGCGFFQWAD